MCKKFLVLLLGFLLISLFNLSYAVEHENVVSIKNNQITLDDKIELVIDVSKIEYEKSVIEIVSTSTMENVAVENEEELDVEKDNDKIVIELDKNTTSFEEITVSYKVPETVNVGDNIVLNTNVINLEDTEEELTYSNTITVIDKNENQDNDKSEDKLQKDEKNNKDENIDEKINKDEKLNIDEKSLEKDKQNNNVENSDIAVSFSKANISAAISTKTASIVSSSSNKTSSKESTATYNGSDNNYLSALSIEGYELNKDFSKEIETYFLTVDSSVSSVNVVAEAEDSTSKLKIYGNDDLQNNSKILITVTAQNGNTRNYRIYLNKSIKTLVTQVSASSQVKTALEDKLELHATYYLQENYAEKNQEIKQGENILQYTNGTYLKAPYDCVITELNLPDENSICTNEHYVTIQSTKQLKVQVSVDESKIAKISLGSQAKIKIPALDNNEYTGTVTNISTTASKGKFTVTVSFENDGDIKIGMSANVEI